MNKEKEGSNFEDYVVVFLPPIYESGFAIVADFRKDHNFVCKYEIDFEGKIQFQSEEHMRSVTGQINDIIKKTYLESYPADSKPCQTFAIRFHSTEALMSSSIWTSIRFYVDNNCREMVPNFNRAFSELTIVETNYTRKLSVLETTGNNLPDMTIYSEVEFEE